MRVLSSAFIRNLVIFCGAAVLASPTFGQTTFATLTGLVTDGAGAVVPGAVGDVANLDASGPRSLRMGIRIEW